MKKSTSTNTTIEQPPHHRTILWVILALALTGLGVSVKLNSIHYHSYMTPDYDSVCNVNEGVNCVAVAASPYSIFLDVPVSAWSYFGYLLMAMFALWGFYHHSRLAKVAMGALLIFAVVVAPILTFYDGYLQETWIVTGVTGLVSVALALIIVFTPMRHPWPLGIVLLLIAAATAISSILAYISITIIKSVCLFCTALYLINLLLVTALVVYAIKTRTPVHKAIFSNVRGIFSKPAIVGLLFVTLGGAAAAHPFSITPYWHQSHGGPSLSWSELPKLPTGINQNKFHWIGAENALVTIVEFSDYQCPYCRRAHKNTRLLAGKYPKTVRLIHRHLPLDRACNKDISRSFHDNACEFARAAECAGKQHQFWRMNDALFEVQDPDHNPDHVTADDVDTAALANRLGLDREKFNKCMAIKAIPYAIKKDLAASRALSVKGTPTFFIDGQAHSGGVTARALESALKRATQKK